MLCLAIESPSVVQWGHSSLENALLTSFTDIVSDTEGTF